MPCSQAKHTARSKRACPANVQEQSTEHSPRDQASSPRVASEGSPQPPLPGPHPSLPFLSTAGRCLSYVLKAVSGAFSWTVTAAKQGSIAMAAATHHSLQSACHHMAQHARHHSVVQTTPTAAAAVAVNSHLPCISAPQPQGLCSCPCSKCVMEPMVTPSMQKCIVAVQPLCWLDRQSGTISLPASVAEPARCLHP